MIQESETQRNARTCAGEEGGNRVGWSSDENGARVHRFRERKGVDKGLGGAGTCNGADLLDPGGLQIRQDQRNQRAVPTSVLENRAEERTGERGW